MSRIGERLGPYEILGALGSGGMGEVHLARDTRLEREVALKVLPPGLTRDPEQMARFRREALTLASLNHPNIATIHGLEETPGGPMVLVLERVEGVSLAERIRQGPLPVEEALQICAVIALAIEVAHERGVVHRDLKPANVMLGPRMLVKVLDFGLARRTAGLIGLRGSGAPRVDSPFPHAPLRPESGPASAEGATIELPPSFPGMPPAPHAPSAADDTIVAAPGPAGSGRPAPSLVSEGGTVSGTPGYMSPEQVLAGEQDERTDIFALGCVLYECLVGLRAFPAADPYVAMASVLSDTPDYSALPARTPASVRELIARCLEKEVERRPAGMRGVRVALEEALGIRRASALREGEVLSSPNNLPALPSSFVGRARVLADCDRLLESRRLVTLLGMGGSGKTRLALQLAQMRLEHHPDGVWFVDLAPTSDPARVLEVLAETLGVREEQGQPLLKSVIARLGAHRVLLVIDNCEDVLAGVTPLVTQLLRECPGVRVLATSREPLGATGETVFAVPTLVVPAERERDTQAIVACEAVQLFAERARTAHPAFELTVADAPVIAEICRRLDGIPLAIELAAARVRMLGVEQIRARLDDRFRLLTGDRSALPRHQTLLATIQWSWDHLAAPEQQLMGRLAVFVGGWTLERAATVCVEQADEFEALDLLTRLADRSLVVISHGVAGGTRYRFLESVWRFARQQLERSGELPVLRERHLDIFLALSESAERGLNGPQQEKWSTEVSHEQENVLAAFDACPEAQGGAEKGLRLAAAAQRIWSVRGQYELGRRILLEALRRDTAGSPTAFRATALVRAGAYALYLGDHTAARAHIEESLSIYREIGDRKGVARALAGIGTIAIFQGAYDVAWTVGEESLAIYRDLGEMRGVAIVLHNLGNVAQIQGHRVEARDLFERAVETFRRLSDELNVALTLSALGPLCIHLGDLPQARRWLAEGLEIARRRGAPREAVALAQGCAELAWAEANALLAAQLLGAAGAVRESLGLAYLSSEQEDAARLLDKVRDALGEATHQAELARGQALGLEGMLGVAQAIVDESRA